MKKSPTVTKLSNAQLAQVLSNLPMLKAFIKAVEIEAMMMLHKDPTAIPGYKVVEGQSRRRWKDPEQVLKTLLKLGHKADDVAPRKLDGLGEIAKLLPAPKREAFMHAHTIRPVGRPVLASAGDPRPGINGNAAIDFADEIEDTW